jgi:hypothetical protein
MGRGQDSRQKWIGSGKSRAYGGLVARLTPQLLDLKVPRFEFSTANQLTSDLEAMGLKRAMQSNAFPGIASETYLSDVTQKTYIRVDEEGTEAAAVTSIATITLSNTNRPRPSPLFSIAHFSSQSDINKLALCFFLEPFGICPTSLPRKLRRRNRRAPSPANSYPVRPPEKTHPAQAGARSGQKDLLHWPALPKHANDLSYRVRRCKQNRLPFRGSKQSLTLLLFPTDDVTVSYPLACLRDAAIIRQGVAKSTTKTLKAKVAGNVRIFAYSISVLIPYRNVLPKSGKT